MRVGYIITAHTLPDHLVRLVRRLDSENAHFFIHLDLSAAGEVVQTAQGGLAELPNVRFLARRKCSWASFSLVEAALDGVKSLLEAPEEIGYGVLLTGQDYPLKTAAEIESALEQAGDRSFMGYWPSAGRYLNRVQRWNWHGEILGRRVRLPNRAIPLTVRRSLPAGLEPFTGSAHWCLSRACLELVRDLESSSPETIEFFHHAAVPDETFFQTVLLNSPLAGTIVNDDLRYIDWSGGGNSPRVLTSRDLNRLLESQDLFARKFDPRVDAAVLDGLDAALDAGPPVPG